MASRHRGKRRRSPTNTLDPSDVSANSDPEDAPGIPVFEGDNGEEQTYRLLLTRLAEVGLLHSSRLQVQGDLGYNALWSMMAEDLGLAEIPAGVLLRLEAEVQRGGDLWARAGVAARREVLAREPVVELEPGPVPESYRLAPPRWADRPLQGREEAYWKKRLFELLRIIEAPILEAVNQCRDPSMAAFLVAGKARSTTIRSRVRYAYRLAQWLRVDRAKSWPSQAADLLDYITLRAEEPCGSTVPRSIYISFKWMEKAGGFRRTLTPADERLVLAAVEATEASLGGKAGPPRRAPRLFVMMMEALEWMVVNAELPLFVRYTAWVKLLKIWATLRHDDLCHVEANKVYLTFAGLSGVLSRTKTTGPGKRVRSLPFFVSHSAWVRHADWLGTGFSVWRELTGENPQTLLLVPSADLQSVRAGVANYALVSSFSKEIFRRLKEPDSRSTLLANGLEFFWSEHSERSMLPSALAARGVPKHVRDLLGRWAPDASDLYVRTYRAAISRVQSFLAETFRHPRRSELVDEDALCIDVMEWVASPRCQVPVQQEALQDTLKRLTAVLPMEGDVPVPRWSSGGADLQEMEFQAQAQSAATRPTKKYFLHYTKNRKSCRIHINGQCWWSKAEDLGDWSERDGLDGLDVRFICRLCQPGPRKVPASEGLPSSSSDASPESGSERQESVAGSAD